MSLIACIQDQGPYYQRLVKDLENEVRINSELNAIKRQYDELVRLLDMKQNQVIALEKQSKKEYEDVRKLRHLSFKSAAATLSGKKKELKAKEEAGYQLAFENEQRAKRELENLQIQLNEITAREKGLEKQKIQYNESRAQFNALLEQIFESDDPSFPVEIELKAEIRNYYEQKRLAKRDQKRFLDAEDQLMKASTSIKKAMQLLSSAVNYEHFDIFATSLLDQDQVTYVEATKKKIWDIQRLLNAVRTFLPEIPYPQTLDVVTNNPLLHVQLSWNYVDIAWKAKASQCLGQLAAVQQNVQNSANWVIQYKNYAQGAIDRLETAIEASKASLEAARRRTIESVLAGHPDHLGSCEARNNPPPPVYEAPPSFSPQGQSSGNDPLPSIPSNLSLPSNQASPIMPHSTPAGPNHQTPQSTGAELHSANTSNPFLHPPSLPPKGSYNANNPFNSK